MSVPARRRPTPRSPGPLPEGEPSGIVDIHDALIIREGDVFLVTDRAGNVPPGHDQGLGLYHADTRHLSTFNLFFHTTPPIVLLCTGEEGYAAEHILTNPKLLLPEGGEIPGNTIEVRRRRVIWNGLEERLEITNYHHEPIAFDLHLELGADFANIFEVRGYRRRARGALQPPATRPDAITYEYHGLDGEVRWTEVWFATPPDQLTATRAVFNVTLRPRERWSTRLIVAFRPGEKRTGRGDVAAAVARSYERWLAGCTQVETDNEFFNKVLNRSLRDLRMLWNESAEGLRFPAAGTPWFDTLFGRDALIVGLQTLAFRPEIARETLLTLARWQGRERNPWRDEEPGKILHEYRRGEVAQAGELPFSPYYGSIDATPLFLLLAAEYFAWTADQALLERLRPNLLAAIAWMDQYGDLSGEGYVEYEKHSRRGLVNQGWKDSQDGIPHADGRPASAPVALVEVQGYVYAAKRRLASALQALGERGLGERLTREALALKRKFQKDFWLEALDCYALALDGARQPCRSVSSNAGHALWTGIATAERAHRLVARLQAKDMFSGWGIRTLSERHPSYNPLGYHVGTVWPHDNAIAAFGYKVYGHEEALTDVVTALYEAALCFPDDRLPELFGGQPRDSYPSPVPYPVACRPQAWAAGAFPMLLQALLGLRADAPRGVLYVVRPRLPPWLREVTMRDLRLGQGSVDLRWRRRDGRTTMEVLNQAGNLRVELSRHWPH